MGAKDERYGQPAQAQAPARPTKTSSHDVFVRATPRRDLPLTRVVVVDENNDNANRATQSGSDEKSLAADKPAAAFDFGGSAPPVASCCCCRCGC